MRMSNDPRARGAFTTADARGNNPHGTYEQAEAEGRRLNAGRYETVGQVEQALDHRARALATRGRPIGEVPAPQPAGGGSVVGALLLLGLGAAIGYFLLRREDSEGEVEDEPATPAPASPTVVTVPVPAPVTPTVQVVPAPIPNPDPARRRRRKAKASVPNPTPTVEVTVATAPVPNPTPSSDPT